MCPRRAAPWTGTRWRWQSGAAMLLVLGCGLGLLANAVALGAFSSRLPVHPGPRRPAADRPAALPRGLLPQMQGLGLGHASGQAQLFLRALGHGAGAAFLTAPALHRYL